MSDEAKKAWVFMAGVVRGKVEDALNELAATGYHVYRMDRWEREEVDDGPIGEIFYDIVALNPTRVGELHGANLTKDLMQGLQAAMAAGSVGKAP